MEQVQIVKEIFENPPDDFKSEVVRISWAPLDSKVGIDIRKFRAPFKKKQKELFPSKKGIRVTPKVFMEILNLSQDKVFMKNLGEAINGK